MQHFQNAPAPAGVLALARRLAGRIGAFPAGGRSQKSRATGRLIALETGAGQAVWSPRDYQAFAREGLMQNAVVYRCVRMIAEAAASVPLIAYEGRDEIEDHPLIDLLARPNPAATGTDLLESFYGFLLVAGNAYVEAVGYGGNLRELHVLRPDRMKVVPGADGWPIAWEYSAGGETVRMAGEAADGVPRILHLKLFHPANDHYGLSPTEAAATAIDIHNAASKWNKALLDNSARPSGALVYGGGQHLPPEQFQRLKEELSGAFQGARNAGRPMLLEGGLDWKAMSLSPRDMDFIEAKHAAAREIALAIGVPPMLLGIPGDNTYSNYAEANRAFWRQTVLPLVARTATALARWLSPAWGSDIALRADLDQVEALSPEREALWARLEKASFLTDDEKRAAVGYGGKGVDAGALAAKAGFRIDQPRNPAGSPGAGEWAGGSGGDAQVHLAQARGGNRRLGESSVLRAQLNRDQTFANQAVNRVQQIDPSWRPPESIHDGSIQALIAHHRMVYHAAQSRMAEVLPRGFGSYEAYANAGRQLRRGFEEAGYRDVVPMIRGSAVTGRSFREGRPFDGGREPSDFDYAIVSPSMFRRATELGLQLRGARSRTGPLSQEEAHALSVDRLLRSIGETTGRRGSFMIYNSVDAVTRRGPSRFFPEK